MDALVLSPARQSSGSFGSLTMSEHSLCSARSVAEEVSEHVVVTARIRRLVSNCWAVLEPGRKGPYVLVEAVLMLITLRYYLCTLFLSLPRSAQMVHFWHPSILHSGVADTSV